MPSTKLLPPVIKYGIAHAENLYTLSELVNSQIKKGYQPVPGGVQYMPHGEVLLYVQVLVMYQDAKDTIISKKIKKQPAARN